MVALSLAMSASPPTLGLDTMCHLAAVARSQHTTPIDGRRSYLVILWASRTPPPWEHLSHIDVAASQTHYETGASTACRTPTGLPPAVCRREACTAMSSSTWPGTTSGLVHRWTTATSGHGTRALGAQVMSALWVIGHPRFVLATPSSASGRWRPTTAEASYSYWYRRLATTACPGPYPGHPPTVVRQRQVEPRMRWLLLRLSAEGGGGDERGGKQDAETAGATQHRLSRRHCSRLRWGHWHCCGVGNHCHSWLCYHGGSQWAHQQLWCSAAGPGASRGACETVPDSVILASSGQWHQRRRRFGRLARATPMALDEASAAAASCFPELDPLVLEPCAGAWPPCGLTRCWKSSPPRSLQPSNGTNNALVPHYSGVRLPNDEVAPIVAWAGDAASHATTGGTAWRCGSGGRFYANVGWSSGHRQRGTTRIDGWASLAVIDWLGPASLRLGQ
jgi:hypothetical protein